MSPQEPRQRDSCEHKGGNEVLGRNSLSKLELNSAQQLLSVPTVGMQFVQMYNARANLIFSRPSEARSTWLVPHGLFVLLLAPGLLREMCGHLGGCSAPPGTRASARPWGAQRELASPCCRSVGGTEDRAAWPCRLGLCFLPLLLMHF